MDRVAAVDGGVQPAAPAAKKKDKKVKKKRMRYSVKERLQLLADLEEHGMAKFRELHPKVDPSCISKWKKNKKVLQAARSTAKSVGKKPGPKGDSFATIEAPLLEWFANRRRKGVSVTPQNMWRQAQKLAEDNGLKKVSRSWITRWLSSKNLSYRRNTRVAQVGFVCL